MRSELAILGRLRAPLVVAGLAASPTAAQDLTLGLPADCVLGETCYIQQFVDRDPGPGVRDYACGTLANDGHKGTDVALPDLAAMIQGVDVVAAAAGTVLATRDGMPDISADAPGAPDLTNRECGNGVVLQHTGDWQTQYCHLRQGSVSVRTGDTVPAGAPLGLVGMSGLATFPHVHLSVRRGSTVIDPFRPDATATCGDGGPPPLWRHPPPYRPGGLISVGLLDRIPDYAEIKAGLEPDGLAQGADAVVVWAYLFAGRAGDVVTLEILGPAGSLGREDVVLERDQPFLFRAWGRRAPPAGWPDGDYSATVLHRRGGQVLDTARALASLP